MNNKIWDELKSFFIFVGITATSFLLLVAIVEAADVYVDYRIDAYIKDHPIPPLHSNYSDYKNISPGICDITLIAANDTVLVHAHGAYSVHDEARYPLNNGYSFIVTFYDCIGKLIKT